MIAPWIEISDLEDQTVDLELAQIAIESATFVLWVLSARKYGGVRTTTEIYCQAGLDEIGMDLVRTPQPTGWQVWPYLREGVLTNMIGGGCGVCGCPHLIRLRGGPILSVESMVVGGRQLSSDEIAIYDYSYVSAGKNRCWASCDDVEVTYTFGAPPPSLGKRAAKELADQFILAATGDDECSLPQRVTSVSRQGMSWTLLDPQDFLDKGLTGLYLVDLFLRTANPNGAQLRARVFSPDVPRGKTRRVTQPTVMMPAVMTPMKMSEMTSAESMPVASSLPRTMVAAPSGPVNVYQNRPLRWVVPGSFDVDHPPVITVQPSGREVPPDALLWRTGNYTLDLTADQVEQLLPPGSALVVSRLADDGSTTGQASYPVERRSL